MFILKDYPIRANFESVRRVHFQDWPFVLLAVRQLLVHYFEEYLDLYRIRLTYALYLILFD